jgi:hypothetical protein
MFDGTAESVLRTGALAERAVANAAVQHLGVTTFESTPGERLASAVQPHGKLMRTPYELSIDKPTYTSVPDYSNL